MSYTKTTWSNGDVISAAKLNNAEGGIEANDLAISDLKEDLTESVGDLKSAINSIDSIENNSALVAVKKQSTLSPCNVFNKKTVVKGYFNSSGEWIPNENRSYSCCDFIPVTAGQIIKKKDSNNYTAFFDSTYTLIGSVIIGERSTTAPANSAFVRVAPSNTAVDTYMVFIDVNVPTSYYEFGNGPSVKMDAITGAKLLEEKKKTSFEIVEQIQHTTGGSIVTGNIKMLPVVQDGAYINSDCIISAIKLSVYKVEIYDVYEGQVLCIAGDGVSLTADYPLACFYTDLISAGTLLLSATPTPTDYNLTYTAPSDGYIVVATVSAHKKAEVYNVGNAVKFDALDGIKADIEALRGENFYTLQDQISEDASYPTYYISRNGSIQSLGSEYPRFVVHEIPVEANKYYSITGQARLSDEFPIAGFKTTSGTSGITTVLLQGNTTSQTYDYVYKPTANGYIFIASVSDYGVLSIYETAVSNQGIESTKDVRNPWYGKKVVWLGTSVSFGQYATKSYAQEIANYLGFTLVNCSVPGLAIEMNDGEIRQYGSLTASKAEYAAAGQTVPAAPITPYKPGGRYNGYYETWENVFTEENADADLWVFDVAPNNSNFALTDWNAFDKNAWEYPNSTFADHRNTFIGAVLFLMDKMYTLNPDARMVFFLGSTFAYANGKSAFETIANQWKIGIIDVWSKINTSPKSLLKIKSQGGTDNHPSTFAHELMGKMLIGEFNRFA